MSARAHDIKLRTAKKPDLKVVKRKKRKLIKRSVQGRKITVLIAGAIVTAALIAAILLEQVVLAETAFHLSDLRNRLEAAEEQHEILILDAARLDSPARIERYARENLGMLEPVPGGVQYIVADIKGPKRLPYSVGGKHRNTLPTGGVATGDEYTYDGAMP